MVNQFVHLKTKSHYSILESSIKVDDLIRTPLRFFFILESTTNAFEILTADIHPEGTSNSWKNRVGSLFTGFRGDITEKLNLRFVTV